jgi:hypothetical protein
MSNVLSLVRVREERTVGARERLSAAQGLELPKNPYIYGATYTAVLLEFQWRQFDEFLDAFEVDPTRDVTWERLVDVWAYLSGQIWQHMKAYFKDRGLYEATTSSLAPKLRAYLDALGSGDRTKARELARQLNFWTTAPSLDRAFESKKPLDEGF